MKTRIISGVIGTFLLLFVVLGGVLTLRIGISIVAMLMVYELFRAVNLKGWLIIPAALFSAVIASDLIPAVFFTPMFCAYVMLNFMILLLNHEKIHIEKMAFGVFFSLFVGLFMSCITKIRMSEHGDYWIWLVFLGAWACDIFAYFVGIFFGKKKLCPSVSPKKTIAGAVGGTLGSALCFLIFGLFAKENLGDTHPIFLFLIGGLVAVCGQLGDLSASIIKRQHGIKDFGKIMPGHGGVMDRFDSILFVAPALYLCLLFII